jgi:hypothetical protein
MCKNRNIFCDITLWDDFVGNLLYPAILGSLIYEFTNFKSDQYEKYIFMFITAVFYIVDYFYMHYTYIQYKGKYNEKVRTWKMIFLDFAVAVLFAIIILCINKIFSKTEPYNYTVPFLNISYYFVILLSTFLVFVIALCYTEGGKCSDCIFYELIITSTVVLIFRCFILNCCKDNTCCIWIFEVIIYGVFVALYVIAVNEDYCLDE